MEPSLPKKGESKREDLVKAAKELLWERGYEAMSPRDVIDKSGAGQGSFYHHFAGKLELASYALEEVADEEIRSAEAIFSAPQEPLTRIRNYLNRDRQALKGCRLGRLANESAIEIEQFSTPIAKYLERVVELIESCFTEAKITGKINSDIDTKLLANTIVAIIQGGYVLSRVHHDPKRMQTAIGGAHQLLNSICTK